MVGMKFFDPVTERFHDHIGIGIRFYAELPILTDFRDVAKPESFRPLPDDWHVVMSDVRGYTTIAERTEPRFPLPR